MATIPPNSERIAKIQQEGLKAVGGGIAWAGFWVGLSIFVSTFGFLHYLLA